MTKTFPLLPDLTCPELAGYKLPEIKPNRTPIAINVKMAKYFDELTWSAVVHPDTHPDGTVKGRWVYE